MIKMKRNMIKLQDKIFNCNNMCKVKNNGSKYV